MQDHLKKYRPVYRMKETYIGQLTFLRFIAATVVIIFHYGNTIWPFHLSGINTLVGQGAVAVSFFFFLSGFVLMVSNEQLEKINYKKFIIKRIARIYPVYILGFTSTLLVSLFLFGQKPKGMSIILQALGLHAWVPGICLEINYPGWSVSVEIFFYLLFPVFFYLFKKGGLLKISFTVFFIWLLSAWIHYYLHIHLTDPTIAGNKQFVLYFPLWHLNTFLFGMLAAHILVHVQKRSTPPATWILRTGLFISTCCFFVIIGTQNPIKPFILNGLLSPLFLIIILSLSLDRSILTKMLESKTLTLLGNSSYAMYILQCPVYLIFISTLGMEGITGAEFYLYFLILVIISIASYLLIERPARLWIVKKWG